MDDPDKGNTTSFLLGVEDIVYWARELEELKLASMITLTQIGEPGTLLFFWFSI